MSPEDGEKKNESRALSPFYLAKNLRFVNILLSREMACRMFRSSFSSFLEKKIFI